MSTQTIRQIGASAAAVLAVWTAGCNQDAPAGRPPPPIGAIGAHYTNLPMSTDVLTPVVPVAREYGKAGPAPAAGGTGAAPADPTKTGMGGTGTMPTMPSGPATKVELSLVGTKAVDGMTAKLEVLGKPTAGHHELAFTLGEAIIKADGASPQAKRIAEVMQATFPYVLAKLSPTLNVTKAQLDDAKLEFENQTRALTGAGKEEGSDARELAALVFGTETLNPDNLFFKGLAALKDGEKNRFDVLTSDAVRAAAGDATKIILPNAGRAGFKEQLPDDLKAMADKPADK